MKIEGKYCISLQMPRQGLDYINHFFNLPNFTMGLRSAFICMSSLLCAFSNLSVAAEPNPATGPEIPNTWLDQHKRIDARLKQGPSDILFISDSITNNWGGRDKAVWDKYYADMNVVSMGISGDRTEDILWRLQNGSLDQVDPKVAVVLAR